MKSSLSDENPRVFVAMATTTQSRCKSHLYLSFIPWKLGHHPNKRLRPRPLVPVFLFLLFLATPPPAHPINPLLVGLCQPGRICPETSCILSKTMHNPNCSVPSPDLQLCMSQVALHSTPKQLLQPAHTALLCFLQGASHRDPTPHIDLQDVLLPEPTSMLETQQKCTAGQDSCQILRKTRVNQKPDGDFLDGSL